MIGIGGSATNDGGAGLLQALGFRLLDAEGRDITRGGAGLAKLAKIEASNLKFQISDFKFQIACDVTNPLCGPSGASAVFGPQKGATPEMVKELDAALGNFSRVASASIVSGMFGASGDASLYPGAGAAGGLGFAFKAFLNAELVPGVDLILSETRLEDFVRDADVVITGEGRLDGQTVMGKAPIGVAKLAKKYFLTIHSAASESAFFCANAAAAAMVCCGDSPDTCLRNAVISSLSRVPSVSSSLSSDASPVTLTLLPGAANTGCS